MGFVTNSIFQESWWLEAVAPGKWGEVTVEANGTLKARWPYFIKKKWGYTFLVMPPLTQTLGPWLRPLEGKANTRISEERKLLGQLLEKLPRFDFFWQTCHHSLTDWLPFYWQGFKQSTKYTYTIENLKDLDRVWQEMKDKTRNIIRKAENNGLKVINTDDFQAFLQVNELTYARQNRQYPHPQALVQRIESACQERNARKIFLTLDESDRVHAGLYLIYDERAAYYLLGGINPELGHSGGMALAVWEAIKFASTVSQVFDFEGSMQKNLELFVRGFGGVQKPFHRIMKCNSRLLQMAYDNANLLNSWGFIKKIFKKKG